MKTIYVIGIWLFASLMFILNIYEDGLIPALITLALFISIGFSAIFLTHKFKWRFVRFLQIVGFGSFFIVILFGSVLPFRGEIFSFSIVIILISIVTKNTLPKKKLKSRSLEARVKNDLKLTSTTVKKKFPKIFNMIGGFVIPALPFVSVINKSWRKKLDKEAIIHENVHLYYLQNGWILGVMVVLIVVLLPLAYVFPFANSHMNLFSLILVVLLLVHFEYITFNKTNRIADELGIATRRWNKKLAFTYLIIYGIQIFIIFSIIEGIRFVITFVRGLI